MNYYELKKQATNAANQARSEAEIPCSDLLADRKCCEAVRATRTR